MILRYLYLDNFFVQDDLADVVKKNYNFYIENLLYYIRIFEYNGTVLDLLQLPYNLFQDLILKQIELKKKELEEEKKLQSQLKAATNNKRLYG